MRKKISCFGLIVALGLILLAVAKPIINGLQFCTPNDPIFQTIEEYSTSWQSYFATLTEDETHVLRFSVSGNDYVAFIAPWDTKGSWRFFVPVIELRQDTLGSSGYVYSSSDHPLNDWRYEIEHIRGDIYCYRMK
jgi:hypothetical protein